MERKERGEKNGDWSEPSPSSQLSSLPPPFLYATISPNAEPGSRPLLTSPIVINTPTKAPLAVEIKGLLLLWLANLNNKSKMFVNRYVLYTKRGLKYPNEKYTIVSPSSPSSLSTTTSTSAATTAAPATAPKHKNHKCSLKPEVLHTA